MKNLILGLILALTVTGCASFGDAERKVSLEVLALTIIDGKPQNARNLERDLNRAKEFVSANKKLSVEKLSQKLKAEVVNSGRDERYILLALYFINGYENQLESLEGIQALKASDLVSLNEFYVVGMRTAALYQ